MVEPFHNNSNNLLFLKLSFFLKFANSRDWGGTPSGPPLSFRPCVSINFAFSDCILVVYTRRGLNLEKLRTSTNVIHFMHFFYSLRSDKLRLRKFVITKI